jgi:hypothetical protein
MTGIDVESVAEPDGWTCRVRLTDARSSSEHRVRVQRSTLQRLDPDATDPTELVRRSFEFLLDREPKESILASFDLPLIGRYFPEYEATIGRR